MGSSHPITLETMVFTRCVVIAIPEHDPSKVTTLLIGPNNDVNVLKLEDRPGRYVATMTTLLNAARDKSAPYHIDMECAGVFFADESLNAADAVRGVTITAHSVLYGAIRESVAWLTGRQPHGPLILGLSVLSPTGVPAEAKP